MESQERTKNNKATLLISFFLVELKRGKANHLFDSEKEDILSKCEKCKVVHDTELRIYRIF